MRFQRHVGAARVVAALVLALGLLGLPPTARPVAATDCVTYYCADYSVILFGTGSAHAYDDQGELDCYWNGGSTNTTCTGHYYWIGQMYPDGMLPITITIAPAVDSWACLGASGPPCGQIGEPLQFSYSLSRNTAPSNGYSATRAKGLTMTVHGSGDGDGVVTSSIAGISCTVHAGTTSGTCSHSWYFTTSISVLLTATPDAHNQACISLVSGCAVLPVDQPSTNGVTTSNSGSFDEYAKFAKGHPIVTVATSGSGTVVSSPAGISCPSTCSSYFAPNSNLTLNAAAKSGQVFKGWTGACAGYGATCNLSLGTSDVSTTAVFAAPATPAPTGHATPSPTTRPGATAQPSAQPSARPTAQPATPLPGATSGSIPSPGATDVLTQPGASNASTEEPGLTSAAPPSGDSLGTTAVPAASSVASGPVVSGTSSGPDVLLLVVIVAVIAVALGLGLGLGLGLTRRGRGPGTPGTPGTPGSPGSPSA